MRTPFPLDERLRDLRRQHAVVPASGLPSREDATSAPARANTDGAPSATAGATTSTIETTSAALMPSNMGIQLAAENGAICTGDTGTYIGRYDDLVNGKDETEKIDVSKVACQ